MPNDVQQHLTVLNALSLDQRATKPVRRFCRLTPACASFASSIVTSSTKQWLSEVVYPAAAHKNAALSSPQFYLSAGLRSRSLKESEGFGWSRIPKSTRVGVRFFDPTIELNHFLHRTPKLGVLTRTCWNGAMLFKNFYWNRQFLLCTTISINCYKISCLQLEEPGIIGAKLSSNNVNCFVLTQLPVITTALRVIALSALPRWFWVHQGRGRPSQANWARWSAYTWNTFYAWLRRVLCGKLQPEVKVSRNGPERRSGNIIIAGTAFRLEFLVGWYYDADATMAVPELY